MATTMIDSAAPQMVCADVCRLLPAAAPGRTAGSNGGAGVGRDGSSSSQHHGMGVGRRVAVDLPRVAGEDARPKIVVDVWSDVLCPWCYFGKRGLDVAMAKSKGRFRFQVNWHPFFIRDPFAYPEGITPEDRGVGTRDRPYFHYIKERAMATYGLDMGGKCDRYPSTLRAHCLLLWALRTDPLKQHALMEAVFRAFYAENRYVGDVDVLLQLAAEAGYTGAQVEAARTWLESGAGEAAVVAQAERASRSGLSGVPDFTLTREGGRTTALHGGAHASAFVDAFDQL